MSSTLGKNVVSGPLTAIRRSRAAALLTLALAAALVAPGAAFAHTITISEHANLHLVKKSGSTLREEGAATGTLPGPVSAVFTVTLTRVTGTVTLFPRHGSITLNVNGVPTSGGRHARFKGTMTVVAGTRRYEGARGSATFTGTVDRKTWAASVDAHGQLRY